MSFETRLLQSEIITHDVKRFVVARPQGFDFEPGQGVELAIDLPDWRDAGRPFTPTSLPGDGVLEFTIKRYPSHEGVTDALHKLKPGTPVTLSKPFGTLRYRAPGVFIAAGAGLTPMIAILRERARLKELAGQTLLFSNKTPADVMLERELRVLLGERCFFTCTRECGPGYRRGRIDRDFLARHLDDFGQAFYVCGPPSFVKDIRHHLADLGASADAVVVDE